MAREQRSEMSTEEGVERRTYLQGVGAIAALGGTSVALEGFEQGSNTLSVVGDAQGVTNYELAVTGSLHPVSAPAATPPGRATEDALGNDVHEFVFEGELTSVRLDGPGAVYVNGDPVTPDEV